MEPMKPMEPMKGMKPMKPMQDIRADKWWPQSLGDTPNSAGGQNEVRYAYFRAKNRLAVDQGDGKVQVYDTAGHQISGVASQQSGGIGSLDFTSDQGKVDVASLQKVDAD